MEIQIISTYLSSSEDNVAIILHFKSVDALPIIPKQVAPGPAARWQRHSQEERVVAWGCGCQSRLLRKKREDQRKYDGKLQNILFSSKCLS